MQALVLTDQPLVRVGLSNLLEQWGHTAHAPHVTTIGEALELVQDSLCRLVIIDNGWCDWVHLSVLMARLEPQNPPVQVAVLCHQPTETHGRSADVQGGATFRLERSSSTADPMWAQMSDALGQLLQSGGRPAMQTAH